MDYQCPACGNPLFEGGAQFCPACGAILYGGNEQTVLAQTRPGRRLEDLSQYTPQPVSRRQPFIRSRRWRIGINAIMLATTIVGCLFLIVYFTTDRIILDGANDAMTTACNAVEQDKPVSKFFLSHAEASQFASRQNQLIASMGSLQSIDVESITPTSGTSATGIAVYHYQNGNAQVTFFFQYTEAGILGVYDNGKWLIGRYEVLVL